MTPEQQSTTDGATKRRRTAALAVAAGVLGGGAIGIAATLPTSAAAAPPASTAPATTDSLAPTSTIPQADDAGSGRDRIEPADGDRGGHGPGKGLGPLSDEFAKVLGLSDAAELRTELQSGKSIAQIAEANGVSLDVVKGFLTDQLKVRLDEAVAAGKLTQEQADAKLADAATRIDEMIDQPLPTRPDGDRGGHGPGKGLGPLSDEFAKVLGLSDAAELRTELQSGKSIAQIAEANGVSLDVVKGFVTDQLKVRLDEAVAAGKLTQEQADAKLADAATRIDEMIDQPLPTRPHRGRHGSTDRDGDAPSGGGTGGSGPNIIESSASA